MKLFRILFITFCVSLAALSSHAEGTDAYDPFVDYSEFDGNSDEEADINFFQNGRLFTVGLNVGYRAFTGTLAEVNDPGVALGAYLSYFFDLRFALQISYITGSHDVSIVSKNTSDSVVGSANLNELGINLKYYFNTQNLTRGIAGFNPYVIGGLYNVSRTVKLNGQSAFGKDSGMGANIGFGVEIPIQRDEMYIGLQGDYRLVNFKEENTEIIINGADNTGIIPNGDLIMMSVILGVNF